MPAAEKRLNRNVNKDDDEEDNRRNNKSNDKEKKTNQNIDERNEFLNLGSFDLFNVNNKHWQHFLSRKKIYLLLLAFIVLTLPLLINLFLDKPLLSGEETYYHLSQASEKYSFSSFTNFMSLSSFSLLDFLLSFVPSYLVFLFPLVLGLLTIYFLLSFAERKDLNPKFTFFFLLFWILSPVFIFSFSSLSAYSLLFFFLVAGFLALSQPKTSWKVIAAILFFLGTFFDLFGSLLLLLLLGAYYLKEKDKNVFLIVVLLFISLLLHFFFKQPFFLGPFHFQQPFLEFVSAFGGQSGISFFIFLLALIGLAVIWKRKEFSWAYLFFPLLLPAYFYRTETLLFLSLLITFFATISFIKIFERHWDLEVLKKFTFLLLLLGLLFSTLSYFDRFSSLPPLAADREALTWIKENVPDKVTVFSLPENSYFIRYFSGKEPFYSFQEPYGELKRNFTQAVFSASYIDELFPLLEQQDISVIYITPALRQRLSAEQGLLFLLKNERFKLVHSWERAEIWMFEEEAPPERGPLRSS